MLQMEFVTELFILDMKEMDPSRAGFGTGSCETVDYHAGHDECDSGKAGDTGKAAIRMRPRFILRFNTKVAAKKREARIPKKITFFIYPP